MKCRIKTARVLTVSVIGSVMLTACAPMTSSIATEKAICDAWEDTLFLPSRGDTEVTATGLTRGNQVHAAACEG